MAGESVVRQVSARTHWVVAKPRVPRGAVLVGAALVLAGCTVADAAVYGLIAVAFAIPVLVFATQVGASRPDRRRRADGAGDGGGWWLPLDPGGPSGHDAGDAGNGDGDAGDGDAGGCAGGGCGGCGGGCGS